MTLFNRNILPLSQGQFGVPSAWDCAKREVWIFFVSFYINLQSDNQHFMFFLDMKMPAYVTG